MSPETPIPVLERITALRDRVVAAGADLDPNLRADILRETEQCLHDLVADPPLSQASDAEMIAAIAVRFERASEA